MLISGSACGGNSTSMTGPAIATMRPFSRRSLRCGSVATVVIRLSSVAMGIVELMMGAAAGSESLGTADDLHDLGRDGVLAGTVHDPPQGLEQLVGVLGGRRHRPLAGGVLGGRRLQQRGVDEGLRVVRDEPGQELLGVGLELEVAVACRAGGGGVAGDGVERRGAGRRLGPGPVRGALARARRALRAPGGAGASRRSAARRADRASRRPGRGRPPRPRKAARPPRPPAARPRTCGRSVMPTNCCSTGWWRKRK